MPRTLVLVLGAFCAGLAFCASGSSAVLPQGDEPRAAARAPAESYALPITPPQSQGDSDLCWVFATLSMLETNYLVRHPGSNIELSPAALQVDSIKDRFARVIRGDGGKLEDGGLAVEALALIRQNGLVARADFHGVVDSDPIFASIGETLSQADDPAEKRELLHSELRASLGETPEVTHLDGASMSPRALARATLGAGRWTEFDRSPDGAEGVGPSRDPDARPETRVIYVKLDRMIDLIHRSLARGQAVVAGTSDHAFLVYGADYDGEGRPISYLIKDSLAPFLYRESAEKLHAELNDVTVALEAQEAAATGPRSASQAAERRINRTMGVP